MGFPERAYNDPFSNPWFPSPIKLPIIICNQSLPQSYLREIDRASKKENEGQFYMHKVS